MTKEAPFFKLFVEDFVLLNERVNADINKTSIAKKFDVSRQTLYGYLG